MNKWIGLALLIGLVFAIEPRFVARDTLYAGKHIGEVICYGQTVLRLIAPGSYQSPFARAQIVANRLNEHILSVQDFQRVRLTYPSDIYTASLDGVSLLSVYADEVAFNQSTPESLMGDWINNIKKTLVAGPAKPLASKTGPVTKSPTKNTASEHALEHPATSISAETLMTSSVTPAETVVMSDRNSLELDALNEKISKLESHLKKTKSFNHSSQTLVLFGVNLIAVIVLLVLYLRVKKQIGNFSKIEKTDQLEELENSVSALMKELEKTSNTMTDKAKVILSELENKINQANSIAATPAQKPAIPASAVPEVEIKPAEPAPNIPPPPQPAPTPQPSAPPPAPPVPEKSPAEELAEEIDKQNEAEQAATPLQEPAVSAPPQSGPVEEEMDPDLKEELDRIMSQPDLSRNDKVVELASINVMQEDIARYLNMGVGEVELILQLAK